VIPGATALLAYNLLFSGYLAKLYGRKKAMPENEYPIILDAALLPEELAGNATPPATTVYIVIDVIRATTTLSVLFDRGCQEALLAGTLTEARQVAASMRHRPPSAAPAAASAADGGSAIGNHGEVLLAGESGGVAPPGFDFGNSPAEFATLDLTGRRFVFCTTNGTRALRACAGGRAVFAGCFRNASAVANAALDALTGIVAAPSGSRAAPSPGTTAGSAPPPSITTGSPHSGPPVSPSAGQTSANSVASESAAADIGTGEPTAGSVTVVCSGRAGRVAIDDTVCAGYLIATLQRLIAERSRQSELREGAQLALHLCHNAPSIAEVLHRADAGRAVIAVGLERDLDVCAAIDASVSVPVLAGYDADSRLPIIRAQGFGG
jgi:phosphosulfolactate phosphohydrolase-like enzyme